MLKKRCMLIILFCLSAPLGLCWGEDFNLRYTRWGMTKEEVITAEEKMDPVEVTENKILYKTRLMRDNVELQYVFVDNKLIGATYKLADNYLNSNRFKSTYTKFKTALIKKYGRPAEDSTDWLNSTYINDRKKWGLAISLGHVEYASSWTTNSTNINCSLREENHYVLCLIEYWSTEHSGLQKEMIKDEKSIATKPVDEMDPL